MHPLKGFLMLRARLFSIFQIHSGEQNLTGQLILLAFIPSIGGAIGSPGIEALFLARFGARFLPYMYIGLGIVTFAASMVITAMFERLSKRRLYISMPVFLSAMLVVARLLVGLKFGWIYPVLWLGMYLLWTMQSMLCWGVAAAILDTRQVKRLFPLFSAGSILGVAIGGLLTQPLVGLIGTENLILVWAASLLLILGLLSPLTRQIQEPFIPSWHKSGRLSEEIQHGYQFVRQSSFMKWFSVGAVLFSILFFSLAFPFFSSTAAQFPNDNALAGFLGAFQGATTGVALITSLLIANRLYARAGYMGAMLIFSLIYLAGFSLVTVFQVFTGLAAFRFLQMAWLEGIASPASQGILNIVPQERREQTRAFISGVPEQIGTVIGGLILLLGEQVLRPGQMYLIAAIIAAATVLVVWRAQRTYRQALIEALKAGQPHIFVGEEQPFGLFRQDAMAASVATAGLSDQSPAVRRLSIEILDKLSLPQKNSKLVAALHDEDPGVRQAALRALEHAGAASELLAATDLLNDPDAEVRQQAILSLSKVTDLSPGLESQIRPLLHAEHLGVRARAANVLLQYAPDPEAESTLISMANADDPQCRLLALNALTEAGYSKLYNLVEKALKDPEASVRAAAAGALQKLSPQDCVSTLIQALNDEDTYARQEIARALGNVDQPALTPTLQALADPAREDGALMALEHLPLAQAGESALKYAQLKIDSALQDHQIWLESQPQPNLGDGKGERAERLALLRDSLRQRALTQAQYALRAVGLLGDRAAIKLARENLFSEDPAQRANALEILDSLPERQLLHPLLALWDLPEVNPGPAEKWIAPLLSDPDPWIRACAVLVASASTDHAIQEELLRLAEDDPDANIRSLIGGLLSIDYAFPQKGAENMKTSPTLSIMERILSLRRVPLFSGFTPADLEQVAAITGEHYFVDGDLIAGQNEPGDEMFIIVSGKVKVVQKNDGVEKMIALREPGEYVGEMSIITQEPRMASLVAQGYVRLLCISQKQFQSILRERPDTSLAVMRELINRLR